MNQCAPECCPALTADPAPGTTPSSFADGAAAPAGGSGDGGFGLESPPPKGSYAMRCSQEEILVLKNSQISPLMHRTFVPAATWQAGDSASGQEPCPSNQGTSGLLLGCWGDAMRFVLLSRGAAKHSWIIFLPPTLRFCSRILWRCALFVLLPQIARTPRKKLMLRRAA